MHSVSKSGKPGRHMHAKEDPSGALEFAGHGRQLARSVSNVSSGHVLQAVLASSAMLPGGQSAHAANPAAGFVLPGLHRTHCAGPPYPARHTHSPVLPAGLEISVLPSHAAHSATPCAEKRPYSLGGHGSQRPLELLAPAGMRLPSAQVSQAWSPPPVLNLPASQASHALPGGPSWPGPHVHSPMLPGGACAFAGHGSQCADPHKAW